MLAFVLFAVAVCTTAVADYNSEPIFGCEPEWDWTQARVGAFLVANGTCSYFSRPPSWPLSCGLQNSLPLVEVTASCTRGQVCGRQTDDSVICNAIDSPPAAYRFHHITMGNGFVCGLLKSDGVTFQLAQPYCWPPENAPNIPAAPEALQVAAYPLATFLCVLWKTGTVSCYGRNAPLISSPPGYAFASISIAGGMVWDGTNVAGRIYGVTAPAWGELPSVVTWGDVQPTVLWTNRTLGLRAVVSWASQWYTLACSWAVDPAFAANGHQAASVWVCDHAGIMSHMNFSFVSAALSYGPIFGIDGFGQPWGYMPEIVPIGPLPFVDDNLRYESDCVPNPCQNGGTCVLGWQSRTTWCMCTSGFRGPICNEAD